MKRLWPRRERAPRPVYVGSHEDKLSRLASMRVSPDDDGRTREDREVERKEGGRGVWVKLTR